MRNHHGNWAFLASNLLTADSTLLVFLHRTDVEPASNVSEQAVRPSFIHSKVSGGFRSA